MAKDRARPFSRKHRKYWFTVTGGMLLIGALNLALGALAYEPPPPTPTPLALTIPPPTQEEVPPGTIPLAEVPAAVMQAYVAAFPRTIPRRARRLGDGPPAPWVYELTFRDGAALRTARFLADGAQVP